MTYFPTHKRTSLGKSIHETLEEKNKRVKKEEQKLDKIDSSLNLIRKDIEKEKVETEYLNPEIKNWVETETVKILKERVKRWLILKYPVHIIGPTGCGKTLLALQIAKEFGRPVVWINGDESVTTTDLIGGYSQIETTSIRDK
ncbi:MAG: AAA family ATPase, partial [Nanoarchaeota archaeon]|nr:AAA family ATPase [Nanoarchaeota archaeon]